MMCEFCCEKKSEPILIISPIRKDDPDTFVVIDGNRLREKCHRKTDKKTYDAICINYCPMCGRKL
jgi:hypothetical protein